MLRANVFNDTFRNKHHGYRIVVRLICVLAYEMGIRILKACPMWHGWLRAEARKCGAAKPDMCLISGERGHHDAASAWILIELPPFCMVDSASRARHMFSHIAQAVRTRHA